MRTIRAIIIEDEPLAAERLKDILEEITLAKIEVIGIIESVADAVEEIPVLNPELLFADIRLADGLSFGIFSQIKISCPVIFTTAYEEYALKAFKLNSIDYLLKPIQKTDLEVAIEKYLEKQTSSNPYLDPDVIAKVAAAIQKPTYRNRFVAQINDRIIPIATDDILYFQSSEKITWVITNNGKKYPLDFTLGALEPIIDPQIFFRVNRAFIVNHKAVKQLIAYSNSRYKIDLEGYAGEEVVIVARDRVGRFKEWLGN